MKDQKSKRSLMNLFLTSTKLSFVSFGGGNAIIPFYEKEFIEKDGSLSEADLLNIVTIANSIPGPSTVEMAAGIGYFIKGFWGSIFCMLGVLIPVPIVFTIIYSQLGFIKDNPIFIKAIKAIVPAISGLLLKYAFDYFIKNKNEVKAILSASIIVVVAVALAFLKINASIPIVIMVAICFLSTIKINKKIENEETKNDTTS